MEKKSLPLIKRIFFSPLSWIWESVYFFRRACYDYGIMSQRSFLVPIISVGNLTFGGTGKTPFTLWLAEYLHTKNKKVMILMRGYKGKLENSSGIITAGKMMAPDPVEYGDEPLLFARRLEDATIVVGKNRSANLSFYFPKIEPDVVLLDDGHQHIKIKRKLNIVLFDATMPLLRYRVAPLGYMREGFQALKDTDLVVIGKADIAGADKVNLLKVFLRPHLPVGVDFAEVGFRPNGFYNAANDLVLTVEQIKGKKVICVAGVANPESFFKLLEELGAEVIVTESFTDHHYFKPDEINALLSYAKSEDALLVTTEKDMVRIKKIVEDDLIVFLEVDIHFLSGEDVTKEIIDSCFQNLY
ncbi:MAG: tetraacyldisaccharide 4'-kinase [Bacteriovorax sp.]|nr:tetraacyldisaccharide 4'-kinase [Bacteriovorax sp.]